MTKPGNVLVWHEIGIWGQRILDLMGDVLTVAVMENVRAEPPEYCYWEDLPWLQKALDKAGVHIQASVIQILADRLPQAYSCVRAYHACRPTNIEDYYKNGLLPADPKLLNALATEHFLKPPITQETLNRAVKVVEEGPPRRSDVHARSLFASGFAFLAPL